MSRIAVVPTGFCTIAERIRLRLEGNLGLYALFRRDPCMCASPGTDVCGLVGTGS